MCVGMADSEVVQRRKWVSYTVGCVECEQLEPLKDRGHRSWSLPIGTVKW
jgi:hypothetical protein